MSKQLKLNGWKNHVAVVPEAQTNQSANLLHTAKSMDEFTVESRHRRRLYRELTSPEANLRKQLLERGDTPVLLSAMRLSMKVEQQIRRVLDREGLYASMEALLAAVLEHDELADFYGALRSFQPSLASLMREEYEAVARRVIEQPPVTGKAL